MPKPLKIVIIVFSVLAILAAIIAAVFFRSTPNQDPVNTNIQTQNTNTNSTTVPSTENTNIPQTNTNTDQPVTGIEETDEEHILRLSRVFVERYGSYSNRSNFENITRLEPFMTADFQKRSLAYIEDNKPEGIPEEYYGISTTANSLQLTKFSAKSSGTVRVATRRVESKATEDPKPFTQYATVELRYVAGNWKVDNLTWE